MKAQLTIEFMVIVLLLMTILAVVSIPLADLSSSNMRDTSYIVSARSLLNLLNASSSSLSLGGGNFAFQAYSPCIALDCSFGAIRCDSLSAGIGNASINGIDCASAGGNISWGKGYLSFNISR
jgi:hypothetical protein